MKKLLFLMLSAAVAVSASAGIDAVKLGRHVSKSPVQSTKTERLTRASGINVKGMPLNEFKGWSERPARPAMFRGANITWDFEDTTQLAGWSIIDADGDGYNWSYADTVLTAHSGSCCMFSNSYVNNESGSGGTALTPDNWLISPQVELGGGVEVWAIGQDANYPAEVFAIYVCVGEPTSTADFVKVSPDFTATGEYVRYSASLAAYEGQTGCIAIRHYNVTDQFILNIDDIRIAPDVVVDHYPSVPSVTVTPSTENAYVEWANTEEDSYNLRWRPYVDTSANPIDCDLNGTDDEIDADLALGWALLDRDGDGKNWGVVNYAENDGCFYSMSWDSSAGALTPDNYLFSPVCKLEGVLEFTVWDQGYAETMRPYVMTADIDSLDQLIPLGDADIVTPGVKAQKTTYTFDLSEYGGQWGMIVFRHYNCTDGFYLFLDDIFIGDHNAEIIQPAEWTYVNGLTDTNYTIDGLTPETYYEVEVQAVYNNETTDWCNTVYFQTLAEQNNVYIIGEVEDKNWAPNDGVQMTFEDGVYTATVNFDGRNNENGEEVNYFALTKKLAATADDWATCNANRFGSETDGDFWVTPELMGQELGLIFPYEMSYRIAKGEYKITVNMDNMTLVINKLGGLRGDVDDNQEVGIADVSALIDYLLSGDASQINVQNANCNLDDEVGIADVSALIDYLLSGVWAD